MAWGFLTKKESATDYHLEAAFPFGVEDNKFEKWFCVELYKKILTDCFHRANGIAPKQTAVFWDNALTSEAQKGLVTLLAEAMYSKSKLYLVFVAGVVRVSTDDEQKAIDLDPLKKNALCVNFSDFTKSEVLKIYAGLLKNIIHTAHTGMNVSKALQLGIADLRKLVSDGDKETAISQAKAMNEALKDGRGILKDAGDTISTTSFDPGPMEKSLEIIFGLICFLMGFPRSYVSGVLNGGLSDSGESDEVAVERGLAFYFNSIFKPVTDRLLGLSVNFKSHDWRKLQAAANIWPLIESSTLLDEARKKAFVDEILQ